jgi:hypothetical protein
MTDGKGIWIIFKYDPKRRHDYPYFTNFIDAPKIPAEKMVGNHLKGNAFEEKIFVSDLQLAVPQVEAYWESNLKSASQSHGQLTFAQILAPDEFIEEFAQSDFSISGPKDFNFYTSFGKKALLYAGIPLAVLIGIPVTLFEFVRSSNTIPIFKFFSPRTITEHRLSVLFGLGVAWGSLFLIQRVFKRNPTLLLEDRRTNIRVLRAAITISLIGGSIPVSTTACTAIIKLLGFPPL